VTTSTLSYKGFELLIVETKNVTVVVVTKDNEYVCIFKTPPNPKNMEVYKKVDELLIFAEVK
jgi:tRNA U34 5-methylaminomethyl-2-thiouridine-forming methyltransferase MnmC